MPRGSAASSSRRCAHKSEIVVVVRMPDGSERSLTLEASGLGGGRLRGRDRGADVERTLPGLEHRQRAPGS